jgi:hypothetical protein
MMGVKKMSAPARQECEQEWSRFIDFFNDEYRGRRTRLAVFEKHGEVANDYWVESGLPLSGISIESHDPRLAVAIELGSFTHEISDANQLAFHLTRTGEEDGVDIVDSQGRTTILRFETNSQGAD